MTDSLLQHRPGEVTTKRLYLVTTAVIGVDAVRVHRQKSGMTDLDLFGSLGARPGQQVEVTVTARLADGETRKARASVRSPRRPSRGKPPKVRRAVLQHLDENEDTFIDKAWRSRIADTVGSTAETVRTTVTDLKRQGFITQTGYMLYRLAPGEEEAS